MGNFGSVFFCRILKRKKCTVLSYLRNILIQIRIMAKHWWTSSERWARPSYTWIKRWTKMAFPIKIARILLSTFCSTILCLFTKSDLHSCTQLDRITYLFQCNILTLFHLNSKNSFLIHILWANYTLTVFFAQHRNSCQQCYIIKKSINVVANVMG